ncbi:redoxin domain-containing protein [Pusillimonas sp. TS35]|nr:redoxin domain-containing protein [Pusillimonas sp. TS35]
MCNFVRLLACLATSLLMTPVFAAPNTDAAPTTDAGPAAKTPDTALHPVRGFLPDLKFSLQGAGGKTYTQEDFKGRVVLMFFGYASCPDICPTTMAQLTQAMNELGEQAKKSTRILFISVDPHRDTPDVLQAYVDAFGGQALGLTGTEKQVADVARRYRVAYQIAKPQPGSPEVYEVAHSRGVYFFDQEGRARFLAADSETVDVIKRGVQTLLQQG